MPTVGSIAATAAKWWSRWDNATLLLLPFYLVGLLTGWYLATPPTLLLLAATALLLSTALALSYASPGRATDWLLLLCVFMLATLQMQVEMSGTIRDGQSYRTSGLFRATVTKVSAARWGQNALLTLTDPNLRVQTAFPGGKIREQDQLLLRGIIRPPQGQRNPGGRNFATYLTSQRIYGRLEHKSYQIIASPGPKWRTLAHRWLRVMAAPLLGPEHTAYFQAMILGDARALSPWEQSGFRRTGIYHFLVISGFHIGILFLLFLGVANLLRIKGHWRQLVALVGIGCCVFFIGPKPPVIRAFILLTVYCTSIFCGRRQDSRQLLACAMLIHLILRPADFISWSFWLSYTCLISIYICYRPTKRALKQIRPALFAPIGDTLALSIAIFLGTWPLISYAFSYLPLSGILLNIVFFPLVSLAVVSGLLLAFLLPVIPAMAFIPAQIFSTSIGLCRLLVTMTDSFTLGVFFRYQHLGVMLLYYLLLVGLIYRWSRVVLAATAGFCGYLLFGVISFQGGLLEVSFIDVGQGAATYIRLPNGQELLIDAGPSGSRGGGEVVRYLLERSYGKLDYLFLSHFDSDHFGGAAGVLEAVGSRRLIAPTNPKLLPQSSPLFASFQQQAGAIPAQNKLLLSGPNWQLQSVQWPQAKSRNNGSLVLALRYGDFSLLIPGDLEEEGQKAIQRQVSRLFPGGVTVFAVPHHGSIVTYEPNFFRQTSPQIAVISVGKNGYGMPDRGIIASYRRAKRRVLRSDQSGCISFITDGRKLAVKTLL